MGTCTNDIHVGCAGWSIRKEYAAHFPETGSHLERYAQTFSAVEINSSFYRPHRPATYERWAASVPPNFLFAVKVPKQITHELRLANVAEPLQRFLDETSALGPKLGPLLVQLPPGLAFNEKRVEAFFMVLRNSYSGHVVCEPRHESWFTPVAEQLLREFQVARVAADPAILSVAAQPGGWNGLTYYRLHGSPRIYYSPYSEDYLEALAQTLSEAVREAPVWCIFDNTAEGAATADALAIQGKIGG
jgi:uncharacterized protein YecE (DUF72 family)